jgi:hypothetical protein
MGRNAQNRQILDSIDWGGFNTVLPAWSQIVWSRSGKIKQRTENLSLSARKYSEGQVAQSVEQWTENPRVGGSIPPLATIFRLLNQKDSKALAIH